MVQGLFIASAEMAEQATIWKMAALSGVAFGVLFAAGFGLLEGWLSPRGGFHVLAICAAALVAGTAFGAAMGLFAGSKVVARQTSIDLPQGEVVEHGGPANHFHNFEACGGRLYLTNRNLIFKPHQFNVQDASISIPRYEIASVSKCSTLGVIPNGLLVSKRSGDVERFVVSNRSAWLRLISA
jgi:hypothetical protein